MKQPFVSVIMVNYNTAEHTLECIDSLKSIEYENYEVIVVDNASKKKMLKSYALLRTLRLN